MSSILKPVLGSQLNLGHRLAQGLVGYWLFNEGAGNKVYDLSGNRRIGTFGTGTDSPSWVPGKFGSAILFSNDYISIPTPAISGDVTIAFLVAPDDPTLNDYILDFSGYDEFACIVGYQDNYYNVYGGAYPTGNADDSKIPVSGAGLWDFVVWTLRGTNLKGYVNGIEYISVTNSTNLSPSAGLEIGRRYGTGERYSGKVGFLIIYNRDFSASEVTQLYREPFCMFERDPIELWSAATLGAAPPVGMAGAMTTNTGYWGW